LDISTPANPERSEQTESEWRVVEPETQNRFGDFAPSQYEAPTVELDINEINLPVEINREQLRAENTIDFQPVERQSIVSDQNADDLLETGTEQSEAFTEVRDFDLNITGDDAIDLEPEMNFVEQEMPPGNEMSAKKPVSPFADLFDEEDLLGIEDEIRAEIDERNFHPQPASEIRAASEVQTDNAITPEIVTPEAENQSQELATVNNVNQSAAIEKPNEYATLNFPPEVIDAIAARVVEKLSDKVIEKIAWEIVPDRFDLIVRKTIQNKDRER
jgi:hypothetical protein